MAIVGREAELKACADLAARAHEGFAALALIGEAGIGKTTILRAAIDQSDARILRCHPGEAELRLSFAGIADLLSGVPESIIEQLPPVQRAAIDAVLLRGQDVAEAGDLRVVAGAVLSAVRLLSREGPILIAVDDLQWIDPSSAAVLSFVFRRLESEPVGVIVSVREEGSLGSVLDGAARLRIGPLSLAALHEVIKGKLGHVFARPAMVRLEQASRGNPFYAIAIAREFVAGDDRSGEIPIPSDLRAVIQGQIDKLPSRTRDALLTASVHAAVKDLDLGALEPAEEAGIVSIRDANVVFAHPLYASAVYGSASTARRRRLHRELAGVVDDLEARARHLALAAEEPDPDVAQALVDAAASAARRGATDAAAELSQLAEQLTPRSDLDARATRMIEAADFIFAAGDTDRSGELLVQAVELSQSPDLAAQSLIELATIRWMQNDVALAEELGSRSLEIAVDPALRGAIHARLSWLYSAPGEGKKHAEQALAILDAEQEPGLVSFALHQLVYNDVLLGLGADEEVYERGLAIRLASNPDVVNHMPALWAVFHDDMPSAADRYAELLARSIGYGDAAGLSSLYSNLAAVEILMGRWDEAHDHTRRSVLYAEETRQLTYRRGAMCAAASVAAHRGADDEARALAASVLEWIGYDPLIRARAHTILGFVALSNDDAATADAELTQATEELAAIGVVEPIHYRHERTHLEALVRLGQLDRARRLVEQLERRVAVFPRPWVRACALHGRGLIAASEGDTTRGIAELEAALAVWDTVTMPFERARSLLVYGVMLRRAKQRGAARAALTEAFQVFEQLGAPRWAAKARAELDRSGVRSAPLELTQTEQKVARLAAQGRTNREIAEELFISRRTVEDNLAKVYRKLGIRSRAELSTRLPG